MKEKRSRPKKAQSGKEKKASQKKPTKSLPDFSGDWRMPKESISTAELTARYYYEFARESQTILGLTQRLCHFSRGEIRRASARTLSYPGSATNDLHPSVQQITNALIPELNLRDVSWNELKAEQKRSLKVAFSRSCVAFRALRALERADYAQELPRTFNFPAHDRHADSHAAASDCGTLWVGSSRFYWNGVEEVALRVDWNQGPQAVRTAMEQWFQRHKRDIAWLKSKGVLPLKSRGSYMFRLRDETGAKHPRQKYVTALRGLGAMRLLGSYTLREAIEITKGSGRRGDSLFCGDIDPDTGQPAGRSAWNRAINYAREVFCGLFYPSDEYSLRLRHLGGLPEMEEPISFQRYRSRTQK